ncbi:MAG: TldD/PmbA family protein [Candidatus Helarchaeota archaeon]
MGEISGRSYEEIIDRFREIVAGLNRRRIYVDILYDASSYTRIYKSRMEERFVIRPQVAGIVIRGYKGGVWREFGVQGLEELDQVVERLKKWNSATKHPVELREFEGWSVDKEIKGALPPEEISVEEKVNVVREIHRDLQKADAKVINPIVVYYDSTMERIFVNNEGCVLRQKIPRIRIFLQPIVKEGARVEFDYYSKSGEVGFELIKSISSEEVNKAVQNSVALLRAGKAPSGTFPVVVDPDMAGLIAHESFGHGLEADQILRDRSYLKRYIGKRVASDLCNICDSPVVEGEIGTYFFDDEGIRAVRTVLVEEGILKNVLHDRYTASAMQMQPGGNGRRESFSHKLHVRMSNTYFEAGDWTLEEILEGIQYGVMLVRGFYGMEDPLAGGMQVTSKKGYLIEKGECTQLLGAITMSGYVLDVLQSIDAVGKGPVQHRGGTCGKGHEDYVPVTTGGTYLRAQKAVVGPA